MALTGAASKSETIAGTISTKGVTPKSLTAVGPLCVSVKGYGATGLGVADDTVAIQVAFAAAVLHPSRTCYFPAGTYLVATSALDVPTGLTIVASHGAALKNGRPGDGDRLLQFIGVSDCKVFGLELDGDKASHAAATEYRHNVWMENADNILLRDVYSHDAKGDNFYVGDNNTDANYCTRIVLDNCVALESHRNGLSIVAVDGIQVIGGRYALANGTNPQAGIDIEPNNAGTICRNVYIDGALMEDNTGPALGVPLNASATAVEQSGIHIQNCKLSGSTHVSGTPSTSAGRGLSIRNPRSVWISDCEIVGNAADGLYADATGNARDLHLARCTFERSGYNAAETFNIPDVVYDECWFIDNGQAAATTYDAISNVPTVATVGMTVRSCKFHGSSTRYGIRTGSNLSALHIVDAIYGTLGTANTSLSDDVATRFDLSSTNLRMPDATEIRWQDIRLFRNAANQLRTDHAFILGDFLNIGTATAAGTSYIQMFEQTSDPAAPTTNAGRAWLKDDGSGNTRLVAKFNTGSTTVIASQNGYVYVPGEIEIDGALNHDGTTVGLYGTAPAAQDTGWTTFTNLTTDRTCDANATTVDELADILGTLIEKLKATGIIAA